MDLFIGSSIGRTEVCPLIEWGIYHQEETFFGGRQLRDVVAWVRPPDMLLHRTKSFFLQEIKVHDRSLERMSQKEKKKKKRNGRKRSCP